MIREYLEMLFQSNLAKGIVLGVMALLVGLFWFTSIRNDQNSVCIEAGFGEWSEGDFMCKLKEDQSYADDIIIVAGNTANSPKPQIDDGEKDFYQFLKNSIAMKSNIRFVSASSDLAVEKININYEKTYNANDFVNSIDNAITVIGETISKVPKSNGATYLEAITKASRDAASTNVLSKKKQAMVIVIGSGLSDGGILNFANDDLLSIETPEIIESLKSNNQLKASLNGVSILWHGIGQTVEPQEKLTDGDIEKLKEIYRAVLEARGATVEFRDNISPSEKIENNKYTVKPTPVSTIIIDVPISDLGFEANSSRIVDRQRAVDALKKTINKANVNPTKTVVVTGYMASGKCGNEAGSIDTTLAGNRAEAVKELLEEYIDNEIKAVNGGVFEPEKTECPDGKWSEEAANYRRKVVVEIK